MTFVNILYFVALSGVIAAVICANATRLGVCFKVMDTPGARKKHKHPTPLMGGFVLLAAFVPVALLLAWMYPQPGGQKTIITWIIAIAATTLVGIGDDRHSLSPRLRLILTFLIFFVAASFEAKFNVRVLDFEHPSFTIGLGTELVSVVFTLVCCVGLINAINMADGKNGLVIGLCIGWLVFLAIRTEPAFFPYITLLITGLIVLLVFNLRNKLFLGDGGAYGFASALALLAIGTYNSPGAHAGRAVSAEELILLFAIPVFDFFRLTFKRMRRGTSPMAADRDHLHHHIQDRFGWPFGLVLYLLIALAPTALWMVSGL